MVLSGKAEVAVETRQVFRRVGIRQSGWPSSARIRTVSVTSIARARARGQQKVDALPSQLIGADVTEHQRISSDFSSESTPNRTMNYT